MKNFRLHFPTELLVGPGEFSKVGEVCAAIGKKALIVSYPKDAGPFEYIERAIGLLQDSGVEYALFAKVEPNPRHTTCDNGAAVFVKNNCDHILAIGGGSVMDSAKGISAVAANGGETWDYVRRDGGNKTISKTIPIITVPTTAATGSEANPEAVISNMETTEKCVIVGPPIFSPVMAILDPELHLSIPNKVTADGCVDIISHCLDCYLSGADDCGVQDRLTEGIINTVLEWGPIAVEDGKNLRARRELQYASLLAISEFSLAGRAGSWLMHNIEHAISAYYDIPHGSGMAIVMPRVMSFLKKEMASRLAQLGQRCFKVEEGDVLQMAEAAIESLTNWFALIGRKLSLTDFGIGTEHLADMAGDIIRNDGDGTHYHSIRKLNQDEVLEILNMCVNE